MRAAGNFLVFSLFGGLLAFSCTHSPAPFDEGKWRQQVQEQSVEKLYAPHFKDGRSFNPWMPMEHGGFWRLLKWKLANKPPYTDEEENYRPQFIPGLKQRIRDLT